MKSVIIQRLILAVLLTPFVKVSYSQNITLEVGQEEPVYIYEIDSSPSARN